MPIDPLPPTALFTRCDTAAFDFETTDTLEAIGDSLGQARAVEAVRFGIEMRTLGDDGGLAIHVLSDLCGSPSHEYSEETEILAFDCFRLQPHYHYGPRNKNLRYYWDKTVVPDTLEWTLDLMKAGKLRDMIDAAGYPDVARDLDYDLVRAVLPDIEAKARELQPKKTGTETLQAAE